MTQKEIKKEVDNYLENKPKDEGILLITQKGDACSAINYVTNGCIIEFVIDFLRTEPNGIPFFQAAISELETELKNKQLK